MHPRISGQAWVWYVFNICCIVVVPRTRKGYYDLYLIHSPVTGKKNRIETYRALVDAKKNGLVKKIGVSN
jgi:hypothetical protein